jgi:hypothetical protein
MILTVYSKLKFFLRALLHLTDFRPSAIIRLLAAN